MITISILRKKDHLAYSNMLQKSYVAMFYHSLHYKNLLDNILDAESTYIIAKKSGNIVGYIPTFTKRNPQYGNVINSLPFFGSNGAIVVDDTLSVSEKVNIKKRLLEAFHKLSIKNKCVLSTIITTPFEDDILFYENNLKYGFRDSRIGSVKIIHHLNNSSNINLIQTLKPRCRTAIRKAIKSNLKIEYSNNFEPLLKMHTERISTKGGEVKHRDFFKEVLKLPKKYYSLTYAIKDKKNIAGLLIFRFKDTIEYYTPAHLDRYATYQGMSLLIYNEMKEAIKQNYYYWNFGGTDKSQTGVYKFKKGWNTRDIPYYRYTCQYGDISKILELSPLEISQFYRWFYVIPFNKLKNNKHV